MPVQIHYYQTSSGVQPFVRWLKNLEERHARAKIRARLVRLAGGNPGDTHAVGGGVLELRVDWVPDTVSISLGLES
jgi:putative addiction module killer protein